MRVSVKWLSSYVDVPDDAARLLTARGLEIEGVTVRGGELAFVVVAEVRAKQKIEGSNHLTLVEVTDGGPVAQVVCGAPNVPEAGGKVAWAKPGASLPGGLAIGVRDLKGVRSHGMLCAEDELGLGESHEGILILDADAVVGTPLVDALELADTVWEVNVTPNRPDCLGHLGIARELAAATGQKLRLPELGLEAFERAGGALPQVDVEDEAGCPRYSARLIEGLTVGPSPRWLRRRLEAVGVRPLSNLVDVTNFVLFEYGQPLHAFDHARLAGGRIVVRRARAGETMRTLDDIERTLDPADLLICDAERPVALAGVMGGKDSEVAADTQRVLLESAYFEPASIRRTAKRFGLHSEASQRFERTVDPNGIDAASRRAARLLCELGGGHIVAGVTDRYPRPARPRQVDLRLGRVPALLGVDVPETGVRALLGGIGLEGGPAVAGRITFTVPTFRPDLTREVDLNEEIARMHGFDNVPATLPATARVPEASGDPLAERARDALSGLGLSEAVTFAFVSAPAIAALGFPADDVHAHPIPIANPLRIEQSVMRTSMLPGLALALSHNQAQRQHDVRLFELGPVFLSRGPGQLGGSDGSAGRGGVAPLFDERWIIAGILAGEREGWLRSAGPVDFHDVKGVVEGLCGALGVDADYVPAHDIPLMHPGVAARVRLGNAVIGALGEIHPAVRDGLGVRGTAFYFWLSLDALRSVPERSVHRLPRFPGSSRDISFFIAETVPAARVREVVASANQPLVASLSVLEDYREPGKVPPGKKGMLWSIEYRSAERTLTDAEVDAAHQGVVARVVADLSVDLR